VSDLLRRFGRASEPAIRRGRASGRAVSVIPGLRLLLVSMLVLVAAPLAVPGTASASAVIAPKITMTTPAAGATGVSYLVDFIPTSGLSANSGTVTLALPTGTTIPTGDITIRDLTMGSNTSGYSQSFQNGHATATWTVSNNISAGDTIELELQDVTNGPAGSDQATVSTSADTTSAHTSLFSLTAPQAVSSPSITPSTTAAGATQVDYAVAFTTSSGGALTSGQGTVTVALPTGTVIPNQYVSGVDLTTGATISTTGNPAFQNGHATATWTIYYYDSIAAGDRIELSIPGVTNPTSGGTPTITTSSDTVAAQAAAINPSTAQSVGSPTVSPSTTASGATNVTYTAEFTSSSTGALVGNSGTVTIALPTGAVIPNQSISGTDVTTGEPISTSGSPTFQNGHATATWTVYYYDNIAAGDRLALSIPGVTNPTSSGTPSIATSSDTVAANAAVITPTSAQSVSSPQVSPSTTTSGATGVTYTALFTLSGTGALAGNYGTVTVALPTGAIIPNQSISGTDVTTGQPISTTGGPTLQNGKATGTWTLYYANTIAGGDRIELTIPNVTNPTSAGAPTIATSSDALPASAPSITPTSAQSVGTPTITASTTTSGAVGVTYAARFTTSSTGALDGSYGTVTIALPTGTVIPTQSISGTDLTTGQSVGTSGGPTFQNGRATATWTLSSTDVAAGDRIELTIPDVTNPTSGGTPTIATSSDPVAANAAAITPTSPQAVSSAKLTPSTTVSGAAGVTYTARLTTSSTGALVSSNGTVTVVLPTGAVIPNESITGIDLSSGQQISGTSPTFQNGKATATWTLNYYTNNVAAGDQIALTIPGVTNPTSGGSTSLATSSDPTAASAGSFSPTSAQPVTGATLAVSDQGAGSTGVSYTVDFDTSTTGALTAASTVTFAFPAGTSIPSQTIYGRDLTTGASISASGPSFQNSGATGTWTLNENIHAGDHLSFAITSITNPAAGNNDTISVSTSSDSTGSTPAFQIGNAATPPTVGPKVFVSTTTAAATEVTYTVIFTTTASLSSGTGTITLSAPNGTVLPDQGLQVFDLTTNSTLTGTQSPGSTGSTETYILNEDIAANHEIELTATGVSNPPSVSSGNVIHVSTSSQSSTDTNAYAITAANAIGSPALALSTNAAAATGVTYDVRFTASSGGALAPGQGTITVQAPAGTVIPDQGVDAYDLTTGEDIGTIYPVSGSNASSTMSFTVNGSYYGIAATDTINLQITGVTNPGSSGGATDQITVSSSSDGPTSTAQYAIGAAGSVVSPAVALSTNAASADGVTYAVQFTASSTGALAPSNGTITVTAPTGTVLPDAGVDAFDLTTGQDLGYVYPVSGSSPGNTMTWTVNNYYYAYAGIRAGDTVGLRIVGVTNPGSSGGPNDHITVSTSSDSATDTASYAIGAANPVVSPAVSLSTNVQAATGVTYSVRFTASATGTLAPNEGTITVSAPSGTVIPNQGVDAFDLTTGQDLGYMSTVSGSSDGNTMTWTVNNNGSLIAPGDTVGLRIVGVTNPGSSGGATDHITVSTSSDNPTDTSAYAIGSASPIVAPAVSLTTNVAAATGVTYNVQFTTSATGALAPNQGTITVQAPSGTIIPDQGVDVVDLTTGQDLGYMSTVSGSSAGNTMTWTANNDYDGIPAGDTVVLRITGVVNPGQSGGATDHVTVSTSSDNSTATAGYAIGSASAVVAPAVALSSNVASATGISYTVQFTTSSTGGLAPNEGTITVQAPSGTIIPDQGVDAFDVTAGQDLGDIYPVSGSSAGNTMTFTAANNYYGIPAGDTVALRIVGVSNPASSGGVNDQITVSTSSDSSANTAKYAIGSGGPVSAASMLISDPTPASTTAVYTAQFTTSAGGDLVGSQGTITLTAPSGTVFADSCNEVFDVTTDTDLGSECPSTSGANVLTFTAPAGISAGDTLRVIATGTSNPAAGKYKTAVVTSSDTVSTSTSTYTVGSPTGVSGATVVLSDGNGGSTGVTYTVGFTTSGSGALGANSGTITAIAPTGTVFSNQAATLTDATTGTTLGTTSAPTLSAGGATATWRVGGTTVPAGHHISLSIPGVTNPANGQYELDVDTSADNALAATPTYLVGPQPSVSSVSPSSGPSGGGTSVTISGTNLAGATAVDFGPGNDASITSDSATQITATAPAGRGTVDVTVTTANGTSATGPADQYTFVAPPSVTGVNPNVGTTAGGTSVTITGTGLNGATAVKFGATAAASFSVQSDTKITATSPAGSGTVDVTVTTPAGSSGTSSADRFTYQTPGGPPPPAVTTSPPSVMSSAAASLAGSVNPEGASTTAYWKYGLDPKYTGGGPIVYDHQTQAVSLGAGTAPQPVSATVTDLLPNAIYHAELVATNSAGTTTGSDQTFQTQAAPLPPPPVLGKTVNVTPVSGAVLVKLPGGPASDLSFTSAFTKGSGFVPLTQARSLPSGSQVDSRHGVLSLASATGTKGKTQIATLGGAIFGLTQSRSGITKGLTTLALLEGDFPGAPSYANCPKPTGDQGGGPGPVGHAAKASPKVLQVLHAKDNHGKYRTKGRYSAATVRGTVWDTIDRCDGTLTVVKRGTVDVFDTRKRKTIRVRAGHSYLAKAFGH
jgi:hypothetical protein